jgi:hypothetical protein
MNSCEFVTLISTLSCIIAENCSDSDISLLSAFFTQLGDSLATILALKDYQ